MDPMYEPNAGEFWVPKRHEVVDRLRRRLEHYRQHNGNTSVPYQQNLPHFNEQQRHDTQQYHKKWQDSKAKKSKHKNKDQSNPVSQKLKRKLDGNNTGENTDSSYNYEENGSPAAKRTKSHSTVENNLGSVSVQIVQQINSSENKHPQTIQTNVTVSSTVKSQQNQDSPAHNNAHDPGVNKFECKQEPEDKHCSNSSNSSDNASLPLADLDDIEQILKTLEKEEGPIHPTVEMMINEVINDTKGSSPGLSGDIFGNIDKVDSPGVTSQYDGNFFSDASHQGQNVSGSFAQASQPPTVSSGQTQTNSNGAMLRDARGPAAETLKQMAAQHQNHPLAVTGNFEQSHLPADFARLRNFPQEGVYNGIQNPGVPGPPRQGMPYRPQGPQSNLYPYNQQIHSTDPRNDEMRRHHSMQLQRGQSVPDGMHYGGTKPLSHYADGQPTNQGQLIPQPTPGQRPSSHNMQITQSQNVQITNGSQRVHLSQTQQMQINSQNPQLSLSQQQTFDANSTPMSQAQYEQMKMRQQMMQHKHQMEKRKMLEQQQRSQVPQYMNRPPPDYKLPGNPQGYQGNNSLDPLDTMQNMVNHQANMRGPPNGMMFMNHPLKQEVAEHQTPHTVRHTPNPSDSAIGMLPTQPPPPQRPEFHFQRQHSYPAGMIPAGVVAAPKPTNSSQYSSAIMRNQRPPNVNVGPDGLNISEQRTMTPAGPSPDWARPGVSALGPQHYTQQQSVPRSHMPQQNMMHQQGHRGAFAGGVASRSMQVDMSSVDNERLMMQQRNMQYKMQQEHLQMQNNQDNAHMSVSHSVAVSNTQNSSSVMQGNQHSTDFSLENFLDSNNLESVLQSHNQTDFNLFDDILGQQ